MLTTVLFQLFVSVSSVIVMLESGRTRYRLWFIYTYLQRLPWLPRLIKGRGPWKADNDFEGRKCILSACKVCTCVNQRPATGDI